MTEKREEIPIFFSVDDNYAPYLSVALDSLIRNAGRRYQYHLIVLYQNLSRKNRRKLQQLATGYAKITFVSMEGKLQMITDQMNSRLRCDYFTLTIYFRLLIPAMFPQYDKGIYLDSDIVVLGDIAELYEVELGDNLIGACTDWSIQEIPQLLNYLENAIGAPGTSYVNSGVLLMNLKKLREVKMEERFLTLLEKYHFDTVAPDQDYINAMCHGRIFYLPECWDRMPQSMDTKGRPRRQKNMQQESGETTPKLVHYNLFSKPWCYDNIEYEEYFWEYARHSGYYEVIREKKAAYSEADRMADRECLSLLLERTAEIVRQPDNFREIFESGREARL